MKGVFKCLPVRLEVADTAGRVARCYPRAGAVTEYRR